MTSHTPFEWGSALPVIPAGRVTLRPLRDADVPALFEIFGDVEAMRFWGSPPLQDLAAAHALLDDIRRHFAARTLFQWGVARSDDDAVIGTTTIFQIDHEHRRGVIGFAIRRGDWRRGYASDAVTALIRFAFAQLDLHRLEADPDPHNAASIAVLEKQGFKREGLLRERYFLNGETQDAAYYGLLRREWRHADDVQ
jgi:[ribosomal protein S5]-alanine N-acetyltransferase